jgi:hypothetical protein
MMRLKKIVPDIAPGGSDLVTKVNDFFAQEWVSKDDIAHIHFNSTGDNPWMDAVYIFYDAKGGPEKPLGPKSEKEGCQA